MVLHQERQDGAKQVEADGRQSDGREAVAESAVRRCARAENVAYLATRLA
jgi:hypothetical protein